MIVGNLLGGKFADRKLLPALIGTLLALTLVMGVMTFVLHNQWAMIMFVGLLGAAAFATVSPLQLWVLQKATGAQSLASSLNIGAFNLGNAFGAWLGGVVIVHGPGLEALPWVAALVPLSAFVVALWAIALERRDHRIAFVEQTNAP
jgi:DHA1 family inner membrane transport protein